MRAGEHELEFRHPHAKTERRRIVVPAQGAVPQVRVTLKRPKPAKLRVEALPADARVVVDLRYRGTAAESLKKGRSIVLPLAEGQAAATFRVRIQAKGRVTWTKVLRLKAGKTKTLKVVLQPVDADAPHPRRPISSP